MSYYIDNGNSGEVTVNTDVDVTKAGTYYADYTIQTVNAKLNYTPTFTSSATFVVSSKTGGDNAYVNMTKTKEMIKLLVTLQSFLH